LAQRIDAVHPDHRFLVFSSLTRSRDIIDLARAYKSLDPSHVIVTMTDLSSRYGSLVAAATGSGVKIAFTTNSPGGIGTVNAPDPDFIARNLLNVEVRLETSASA
jgi:flagellar biosynthesis GTPase FlhF